MNVVELRKKIIQLVKGADEDYLRQLEAFINREPSSPSVLTDAQKAELDEQEALYESGEGQTYTWSEVKQELIDKYGLPA